VSTTTQKVTEMHAKSSDVSASLARNPENAEVAFVIVLNQLGFVYGSDTQLLLDGRNQRWSLETRTSQGIKGLFELFDIVQLLMELDHSDVLLARRLLGLDQSRCVVDADDEASCDLGVEGARVASLIDVEDLLDPGDNLVGGWIRRFVKIDAAVVLQHVNRTVGRRIAARQWREVGSFHVQLVVVLKIHVRTYMREMKAVARLGFVLIMPAGVRLCYC